MTYTTPEHPKYPDMQPNFIKDGLVALLNIVTGGLTVDLFSKFKRKQAKHINFGIINLLNEAKCNLTTQVFDGNSYISKCKYVNNEIIHDDGNDCIYAGLVSTTGNIKGLITVLHCIDKDGRFWRSPRLKGQEQADGSFSRDMLMGVLHALTVRKLKNPFDAFMDYLSKNNYIMCPSQDGRGELRVTGKANLYRLGKILHAKAPHRWKFYTLLDGIGQVLSAYCSKVGYRLELVAEQVHLHENMGCRSFLDDLAANRIYKRQPKNAYFAWCANEEPELVAEKLLAFKPVYGKNATTWVWSKDTELQANLDEPMAWSYYFMCSLLEG